MIFSLLNLRKKTAATVGGIVIGATCLWAVAAWQDIPLREMINILLAVLAMLLAIIAAAVALIAAFKLCMRLLRAALGREPEAYVPPSEPSANSDESNSQR